MTVDEVAKNTKKETRSQERRRKEVKARKDRPTPARRDQGRTNIVSRMIRPVVDYFSSTRAELQKVTWPTREETLRLSGIVLAVTAISAVVLGLIDYLYGELFRLGLSAPIIFVIFGVVLVVVVIGGAVMLRRTSGL